MREINKVLLFREDISPFLVHLTRETTYAGDPRSAQANLLNILVYKKLEPGECLSDARNGYNYRRLTPEQQKEFFNAICFTETPISEIHCLLEIDQRQINLAPYGIVFLKENLRDMDVSPAIYINNYNGNNDDIFHELCLIIEHNPDIARKLLPLISVFGKKIIQPGYLERINEATVDFLWEREWRRPRFFGAMEFDPGDVFVGLCPHEEIDLFESRIPWLKFIDPRRNMKWYSEKLIEARQKLDLKHSVV